MKTLSKPKKPSRRGLVKKLDTLFSLFIRARDGHCVTCVTPSGIRTNGHLWSRVAYSTRWDEENAHEQCWGCNLRHEHDPYPLSEYVRNKLGQEKYDALHLRYATPKKFKDYDLLDLIEHYKNILDKQATEE